MKPSRAIALALLAAGCAHYGPELVPAPGVAQVPGEKLEAEVAQGQVRATVSGERWHGNPVDLGALVTPLRVTITNEGREPVRIAYRDFALVSSSGFRGTAMSPFAIQRAGATVAVEPFYRWSGFYIAPTWSPYYPGLTPWGGWWDYGGYGVVQVQPLPSRDMLSKALPEGVLEPGGTVSGYLYFQHVGQEVGSLQFQATLVSPESQQRISELKVPFMVKS